LRPGFAASASLAAPSGVTGRISRSRFPAARSTSISSPSVLLASARSLRSSFSEALVSIGGPLFPRGGRKSPHTRPAAALWLICQTRIGGTESRRAISDFVATPVQYSRIVADKACACRRSSSLAAS
jgi:hypothetical protein